jgi:hypothetical protein
MNEIGKGDREMLEKCWLRNFYCYLDATKGGISFPRAALSDLK